MFVFRYMAICSLFLASTSLAADENSKAIVAVFEIEDRGSDLAKSELESLTDYLGARLGESGAYQIIPRQEIKSRLVEQKAESYKKCYDQNCQVEIGRELAAQLTLSSHIGVVGKTCIVTSALYDLRKAATVKTATSESECGADALLGAILMNPHKL